MTQPSQPRRSKASRDFDPTDPLSFPLELKQWVVQYVAQQLRAQELTGYRPVFAAPNGLTFTSGTGSPNTVITAQIGSLYVRTDGGASTTLYVKESGTGNTGWVAK